MRRWLDDRRRSLLPQGTNDGEGRYSGLDLRTKYPVEVWKEFFKGWTTPTNSPENVLVFPLGYTWRVNKGV